MLPVHSDNWVLLDLHIFMDMYHNINQNNVSESL